jgi:sec-independent protein translocase protein TatB
MEIFNIHLFEFLLIAGLALVIFGPERLPEMGRLLGKQVARFLAWQQQSPELQLLNDVRAELDSEIASLRDELLRTRKQLDVSQDMETLRNDLRAMVRLRDEPAALASQALEAGTQTIAPPVATDAAAPLAAPAVPLEAPAVPLEAPAVPLEAPAVPLEAPAVPLEAPAVPLEPSAFAAPAAASALTASTVPNGPSGTVPMTRPRPTAAAQSTAVRNALDQAAHELGTPEPNHNGVHNPEVASPSESPVAPGRNGAHDLEVAPPSEPSALSAAERDQLLLQIQQLSSELHALVAELHERGMLAPDWRRTQQEREQESVVR